MSGFLFTEKGWEWWGIRTESAAGAPGITVVREALVFSLLSPGQSMTGHVLPGSNVPFTLHSLGYSRPASSPYTPTVHYRDRVPVLSFCKPGLGVGTQGLQYYTRDHRTSASWLQHRVPLRGPNRPLCTHSEAVEEEWELPQL